jgi:hypothetical protein
LPMTNATRFSARAMPTLKANIKQAKTAEAKRTSASH